MKLNNQPSGERGAPFDDGVRYSELQRGKGSEVTQNWAGMALALGPL
jgi:hypothetical protein